MTPYQYANLVSIVPKDFMYRGFDFTVIVVVVKIVPAQSCPDDHDDGSSRWFPAILYLTATLRWTHNRFPFKNK